MNSSNTEVQMLIVRCIKFQNREGKQQEVKKRSQEDRQKSIVTLFKMHLKG